MFERFTERARTAVTGAQKQSRRLGHPYTGTEHLLLALSEGDGVAARALHQVGFDRDRFEQAALDHIGPTLPVGAGDIPFTPRVKNALATSLSRSLSMGHNYIGTEHILLALLDDDTSLATKLVAEQGVSVPTITASVIELLTELPAPSGQPATTTPATAGATTIPTQVPTPPSSTETPRCPGCREPLAANLGADTVASVGEVQRPFTVSYCRACGDVLAIFPDD
jgi:ATP-dependent Clp protease ATP-binding subunit ClpC